VSLRVELFRSDDYVHYGEVALLPLLRAFFEPLIGESLSGARFRLSFLPIGDARVPPGRPSLVNLRASHGYAQVAILRDGQLLYRHPHPIREIISPQLRDMLTGIDPAETHWGFGISGQGMDEVALVRPEPEMLHSVTIRTGPNRVQVFQLEEVDGPEPPEATLSSLGASGAPDDQGEQPDYPLSVVIAEEVRLGFVATTMFSAEVEEGGFLAGRVFHQAGSKANFIIEVTAALQAERTGASMLHFTFTGESFLRVSERIHARQRGEQLLGWYHTHLFAATDALGLSSVDVDLHKSTFRRPWQVAALINVTDDRRMLRFYRDEDDSMAMAPYWGASR
jgi:hypothetical protein